MLDGYRSFDMGVWVVTHQGKVVEAELKYIGYFRIQQEFGQGAGFTGEL
jgi:hypothetical protein